jgi:L-iditol 2-dehydrogenase
MKCAKLYGIRDIRVEENPIHVAKNPDDVVIKVKAVGFCGSDISRYGKLGPHTVGAIFGHEFAGVVTEVGSEVTHVKVGDAVTACPALPCYKCDSCLQGKHSQCENLGVIGAKEPGAFAEYAIVKERNVVKLLEGMNFEESAVIEPTCVTIHGFYRTNIKAGDTVAILGVGPIGLLAMQVAKVFGASKVIAIDVFDEKLEMAKALGADAVINAKSVDPIQAVKDLTNGKGVDIAVESAGTPFTCGQVLGLPKKGGSVIYMGIPYGDVSVPREYFEKIMRNELVLFGAWNAISAPFPGKEWETAMHFIKEGRIKISPMITHRISIDELPEPFDKIYQRDTFFGKVMVFPER